MKTKLFTLLVALIVSVGTVFAIGDCHNCVGVNDIYYNLDYNNNTAEVRGSVYPGGINIPEKISWEKQTYSVTSIGANAFSEKTTAGMSVRIPNSVISIGACAFCGCTGLSNVTMGNSVTSIGDGAFNRCTKLKSIIIPNSVTSIGNYAFTYCAFTSVIIPNRVKSIGDNAFYSCSSLTSVTIGKSVTSIGREAFNSCYNLKIVTCYAPTPPELGNDAWRKNTIGITLYVPAESVDAYKAADGWNNFGSILPISAKEPELKYTIVGVNFPTLNCPENIEIIGDFNEGKGVTMVPVEEGWFMAELNVDERQYFKFRSAGSWTQELELYRPEYEAWSIIQSRELVFGMLWEHYYDYDTDVDAMLIALDYSDPEMYRWTREGQSLGVLNAIVRTISNDENSIIVEWPAVKGADTYTIEIKKNVEMVCAHTFNAQGQLVTLNYAAPSRNSERRNVTAATQTTIGWQYVVTGLEANTQYTYTITARDAGSSTLFTQTIQFTTSSAEGIENVESNSSCTKLLRNGQILILRGDKTYTLQGQEVR